MSKEVHVSERAKPEVVTGLEALPVPGPGEKLIVYVRASSVRLHVVRDEVILEEQAEEAGGAVT